MFKENLIHKLINDALIECQNITSTQYVVGSLMYKYKKLHLRSHQTLLCDQHPFVDIFAAEHECTQLCHFWIKSA